MVELGEDLDDALSRCCLPKTEEAAAASSGVEIRVIERKSSAIIPDLNVPSRVVRVSSTDEDELVIDVS